MRNIDIDFEGYRHKEAFCLMKYASDDGTEIEWIWNSRDGVTPFAICNRAGDKMLKHVDWNLDRRILIYKPAACERIFISLTKERARVKAKKKVDILWKRNQSAKLEAQFGNNPSCGLSNSR